MNGHNPKMTHWKPGVPKSALLLLAGTTWIGVGIMLDGWAYSWLKNQTASSFLLMSGSGIILALVIHHFGFLRIVDKNLDRILPREGKQCLFSFLPWRSYVLIGVMILLGYILRHSSISKKYLAIIYSAIGTALILSSVRYVRYLIREVTRKR